MANSAPPFQSMELALLGLLRQQPRHAYELSQAFQSDETLGMVWRLKQGSLYASLAKLEDAGCVTSTLEAHGSRPPRKMLRLTEYGRQAFAEWLVSPVEHGREFRLEFLAKLYFATQAGPEAAGALIAKQRDACQDWLGDIERQIDRIPDVRSFERLVLQFRLGQLNAILSWLDLCERGLVLQPSL